MTANDYQNAAARTSHDRRDINLNGKQNVIYAAMKISGEAGEFSDLLAKMFFHGHAWDIEKIRSELGDLLWHIADICTHLNISLADLMGQNIEKLKIRYPRGYSHGDSRARVDVRD